MPLPLSKMPLVERLAQCTVRIECELKSGGTSTGTGFFYSFDVADGGVVPTIVTNKHVVKNSVKGRFIWTRYNPTSDSPDIGNNLPIQIGDFENQWVNHPNPEVDLCMMPIGEILTEAEDRGINFFFCALDKDHIPTNEEVNSMIGLDPVIMVGYPNGLWDDMNNLPIFRRGILATDYKRDWRGRKEFLIDAACFPGSSGSPVLLIPDGNVDRDQIKLLGILYAGPRHIVQGEIKVIDVPTTQRAHSLAAIPNHLGFVIKAEQLIILESLLKNESELKNQ